MEVTFLYPWALVFKDLASETGMFLFFEAGVFLLILGVGFVYCWKKGDLDWVKSTDANRAFPAERLPKQRETEKQLEKEPALTSPN